MGFCPQGLLLLGNWVRLSHPWTSFDICSRGDRRLACPVPTHLLDMECNILHAVVSAPPNHYPASEFLDQHPGFRRYNVTAAPEI